MPTNLENTAVATGLEKVSFHSNPKEGKCQRMFKLPHSCTHFTCQQGIAQKPSSQASTKKFQMYKLDLEKAEEPEIKLAKSVGPQKKQENSRKTSASLTMIQPLTVWITTNCGKFLKRGNAKECSNYHTVALISHVSKVMLNVGNTTLLFS